MFIPYQTLSYAKILEKLNQLNLELERQDKFAKIIVTGGFCGIVAFRWLP